MSGHSKFSNIKHRKNQQDLKRSKTFLQLSKQIINALHQGGADPTINPGLRLCLQRARQANMPKANITKIIHKFQQHQSQAFLELQFGGYIKEGVALLVNCLTDNRNRTTAQIKSYFHRFNVRLDTSNCLRLFTWQCVIEFIKPNTVSVDDLVTNIITTSGVENYQQSNIKWVIYCQPQFADKVILMLQSLGIENSVTSTTRWVARQVVHASSETMQSLKALVKTLEEDDDVNVVTHNALVSTVI